MQIKCLVIDDEPSAQIVLKKYINDVDFLQLTSVCNNAIEALEILKKNSIDLIFLDVNMPRISGLTFYKSLQNPPEVIFTTAYPQYAVEGFEVNAIDYLLKPFSFDRFFSAITKFLNKKTNTQTRDGHQYILIKSNKTLHKILINDIFYVEAYGDYVKVHASSNTILTNSTFTGILKKLPESIFVRCHKSFAVNSRKIKRINGNQVAMQLAMVPVGQKYKPGFLEFINKLE